MQPRKTHPLAVLSTSRARIVIRRPLAFSLTALRALLPGLALWVVFAGVLALIQFSTPNLPDNDGFYHIKMAYLMRIEGLKPAFPWLPLSILNPREFYDHHFLFHVALIPFTLGDLLVGAKLASVFFAALALLAVWRLLSVQNVPYAGLWSLGLLAVSGPFLYRLSITRAQSLSLAVLAVALNWLLARRYRRLFFLGFFYVWLYNAFPLLLAVAGVYTAALWLTERRLDPRPLLYSAAGIAAGLVINPYFPYDIVFAYQHFLPKLVEATAVSVGSEWYPYTTAQLLQNSPLALLALVVGAAALGLPIAQPGSVAGRRADARTFAAFGLAVLFGLMLFQARRFIEYFPAFALIFAAFATAPLFEGPRPASGWSGPWAQRARRALPALLLAAALAPGLWLSFTGARDDLRASKPNDTYAGASAWLAANTAAGSRVFQTDWDDFPRLFFYNTHNTYLAGLDPTYLQMYDPALYDTWVLVTQGEVAEPSSVIANTFSARYVVTDRRHADFIAQARRDPAMREVYADAGSVVFQVN